MTDAAHILIAEDDEALREMYKLILSKDGFHVTAANDGVDGLAKARQGGYDLILLDLMMPNLDGLGVLRGLTEEAPKKPNGPVVVLSNAGYDTVAHEAEELGAAGFLMKADLLPQDLVDNVKEYLKKGKKESASGAHPWKKGRPE